MGNINLKKEERFGRSTKSKLVLITIPCLLGGGTEIQTLNLVRALIYLGYDIHLLCYFEYEDHIVRLFIETGTKVRMLMLNRRSGFLSIMKRLVYEISKINPDIVHVQYMAPGASSVLAARLARIPRVFATVHQPYTRYHGIIAKFLLRFASLISTKFICVSLSAEKSWFGKSSLFDENYDLSVQPKHFTIYNCVDIKLVDSLLLNSRSDKMNNENGVVNNRIVIGTVSRLRYEKGIDILIEAFFDLVSERQDVYLLIVGNGPDRDLLSNMVNMHGINDFVRFYGQVDWDQAIQLIGEMDIIVVPSRFEGFGLTAIEAMAAGKPVIASDSFGLQEIITENETGFLIIPEDKEMLKRKLLDLCIDISKRLSMGNAGRIKTESLFGKDLYVAKIAHLYS